MRYDVVIIGGGQAGLSMGFYLNKRKASFVILDQAQETGASWKARYDSLTLFTPRGYSSLPDLKLRGDQEGYPTKDEIAEYLSAYTKTFALPICHNTTVQKLVQVKDGFQIITNQGDFFTKTVVVATGPFQKPFIPALSTSLSDDVLQLHSSQYKNATQLNEGSVLVVGGGNSGAQIAVELAKEREVYFSVGHQLKFLPLRLGRRSLFRWLDIFGFYRAPAHSKVGRLIKKQPEPIMGLELKRVLKQEKIVLKPRTMDAKQNQFMFADGSEVKVENVIWSTGFRSDYQWIGIVGVLDAKGTPLHERGVTAIDGLYFLGLPWQFSRSSALLHGVGADAQYIDQHIIRNGL
ncbi:flavin-containing monooxygenase [Bacillus sp. Hm123]|uniref:flavin-containing monooxygenase n=1 Tax=Bacillus sp. Hm123 TaxID=3450745 RepID=UPI003F421759